ncbi:MAG: [Fe-S]-binding protein [Firmicutes bacterium]|nr:[Fe-S]-binding protein [Bacillota bacterium]
MAKKGILKSEQMAKCLGCFTCMSVCAAANKKSHAPNKAAIRVRTIGGMTTKFIAIFCNGCKDPTCLKACPTDALVKREGGGVVLVQDECIGCRVCETACAAKAINFDKDTKKPIICHHCGICAKYCPHNCLKITGGDE